MRRYIIVALVLCVLVGVACAWPASMGSWDYRKSVTINNTGANLTNYQLMFTVNRSAGSDSNFTVFLDGKCAEDYDDIRFTTSDEETLCDYWIESSSSTVASIWVEVPSIVNSTAYGSTTLYLYYGNSGASAVSDGNATFPLFDNFNTGSIDTNKWNVVNSAVISSGILDCGSSTDRNDQVYSKTQFAVGTYIFRSLTKFGAYTTISHCGFWRLSGNNDVAAFYTDRGNNNQYGLDTRNNDVETISTIGTSYGTSFHIFEIQLCSSSSVKFFIDGINVGEAITNTPNEDMSVEFCGYSSNNHIYSDWVLVRKYTATEPTVSAWGSEESNVRSTTAEFSALPLTGNIPLTVYFTDESTGKNCTVDAWVWSFGDSSPNSTQQNPAHTYTTTGLYDVILTAFNTTYSKEDTEAKTTYINATYDPNAPNADFTVTELCGSTTDTFYFIDFSTGGGLYAWNWSFGDGSYSELRNPTHLYATNGTYDVNLSVWGAYGFDSLLRENLITIPCGAATPTPTPTVTPTGNATPPVQEELPEGHLTPLAFVVLALLLCGLTVYTFADNQNRNYLYIATAAVAMILSFLLGIFLQVGTVSVDFVNTLEEVTVNESVLSTYDVQRVAIADAGFGWFFTFWGVVMLIITILAVVELFREPQRRYEE